MAEAQLCEGDALQWILCAEMPGWLSCVYVCVCVCVCVCVFVCVCVSSFSCFGQWKSMLILMHHYCVHISSRCVCICVCVYVCEYVCMYVCSVCVCMCVYMCVCVCMY